MVQIKRICIFCGSSSGGRASYTQAAESLAKLLASRGIGLVYGGANVGLMGTLADTMLAAGGEVIGVMPQALVDREVAHLGLTQQHIVGSMHERKALMADLADAFIALPGGFGTLDELCEILTWTQLGISQKACGILNVDGYFDMLLGLFDHSVQEGFLKPVHREMVVADADAASLLTKLESFVMPGATKWIGRG